MTSRFESDQVKAVEWARRYRQMGLCPLPGHATRKGPDLPPGFSFRKEQLGNDELEASVKRTGNVVLLTGTTSPTPMKIVVVDCDGEEGKKAWRRICEYRHGFKGWIHPMTWMVETGGGGCHYYFRLPEDVESCPTGMFWGLWDTFGEDGKGRWVKHQEVRLLADGHQVVAPPSRHVATRDRYVFAGGYSPDFVGLPAVAPKWLLELPRLSTPKFNSSNGKPAAPLVLEPRKRPQGESYRAQEVLAAIDDKLSLAVSWGLRLASSVQVEDGWVKCHAAGREDRHPSGSFCVATGVYRDWAGNQITCGLFGLGVMLGRFATWEEACDWCGDQFLGRRVRAAPAANQIS